MMTVFLLLLVLKLLMLSHFLSSPSLLMKIVIALNESDSILAPGTINNSVFSTWSIKTILTVVLSFSFNNHATRTDFLLQSESNDCSCVLNAINYDNRNNNNKGTKQQLDHYKTGVTKLIKIHHAKLNVHQL